MSSSHVNRTIMVQREVTFPFFSYLQDKRDIQRASGINNLNLLKWWADSVVAVHEDKSRDVSENVQNDHRHFKGGDCSPISVDLIREILFHF